MPRPNHEIEVSASRDVAYRGVGLWVILRLRNDDPKLLKQNEVDEQHQFVEIQAFGAYAPPSFSITEQAAQRLMQELWDAGVRPPRQSDPGQALEVAQAHIKDLSGIAQKLVDFVIAR